MAGRHGESYESRESTDSHEKKQNVDRQHLESRYKMRERAQEYEAGEEKYKYETDKQGRIKRCSGELKLHPENERNNYAQRKVGGEDRRKGELEKKDEGGHLIGRRFGGSAEIDNLIAQDSKLNRGEYKKMEDSWEDYLKQTDEKGNPKYRVQVDIRCKYNDVKESTGKKDSERPSDIYVYSKVTDREGNVVEKQIYRFKNEPDPKTLVRDMNKKKED